MLKWAVNQPRPSYLGSEATTTSTSSTVSSTLPRMTTTTSYSEFHAAIPERRELRTKLRRKSTTALSMLPLGKENQLTSTPLPACTITSSSASACRTPRLKDLSNIMPTPSPTSNWQTPPPVKPLAYASTLPTFEAEYSPSAVSVSSVIPGPLLALRGLGIPSIDSYFEKPRYLEQKPLPVPVAPLRCSEQPTLSSTQMGDVTLERMIDAILESTRKAPAPAPSRARQRLPLHQRHRQRQSQRPSTVPVHSPLSTYRPAFDPASDLCEYWQPNQPIPAPASEDAAVFEEREVRSPLALPLPPVAALPASQSKSVQGKRLQQLQLRRQRGVRRKRKIATKISSSVKQSAQKLLLAAARSAQKKLPRSSQRHISPDSGHNSTSDCELDDDLLGGEELETSCQLDDMWTLPIQARDVTKRRLSFALTDDS